MRKTEQFEVLETMKKYFCFFVSLILFAVPVLLTAQTAAEIEGLLNNRALSYGQAAQFILRAADLGPGIGAGNVSPAEAFAYAQERKWLPKNAESYGEVSLEGVSLLIMRSFDIKGGLFYSMFKNPHYAYRELVYRDVIQGRADPGMAVSGEQLLFMVNRVLAGRPDYNDLDFDLDKYLSAAPESASAVLEG